MAQSLSINPTTVVKAYTELQHEGVIEMKHGKGAFVTDSAGKLSEKELKAALRRLVKQVAVEAVQMGASLEMLIRVLREEFEAIATANNIEEPTHAGVRN